ncbi:unnamed protein product [Microthlaspi erraticum]|uniref:Uncharacterized protein n=1 Tax=Microthlaspi erraticum TaxID=1685480 RepID=A0A6D2HPF8_9BRAS|nr:unnamed protein product [Microthlaspi erraticum]
MPVRNLLSAEDVVTEHRWLVGDTFRNANRNPASGWRRRSTDVLSGRAFGMAENQIRSSSSLAAVARLLRSKSALALSLRLRRDGGLTQ